MLNTTLAAKPHKQQPSILSLPQLELWPDPVDGAPLLDDLSGLIRRFVILPKWAPEILSLWILHTYAFTLRDVSTYLGIESPEKRCGKTTLLTLLGRLVNRPIIAANISSSAFYRVIEEVQPTLLIDEADTFLSGNEEMRGILNSGYNRATAYVVRVQSSHDVSECTGISALNPPGTRTRLARFSCWCPKVMAAIGRLPDTLADRCILIRMGRKTSDERCERLRFFTEGDLPRKCARFVLDHASAIRSAQCSVPESLNDRAADIWEPLLVLADLAGGNWPQTARQAAEATATSTQPTSPIGPLLADIFIIFAISRRDQISSRDLVNKLETMGDRPYKEALKGRPLTCIWLGQQLRPYNIHSKLIWEDRRPVRGYTREAFNDAFKRYLPKSEVQAFLVENRATSSTPQTDGQDST